MGSYLFPSYKFTVLIIHSPAVCGGELHCISFLVNGYSMERDSSPNSLCHHLLAHFLPPPGLFPKQRRDGSLMAQFNSSGSLDAFPETDTLQSVFPVPALSKAERNRQADMEGSGWCWRRSRHDNTDRVMNKQLLCSKVVTRLCTTQTLFQHSGCTVKDSSI